jgi:hypothetical protein
MTATQGTVHSAQLGAALSSVQARVVVGVSWIENTLEDYANAIKLAPNVPWELFYIPSKFHPTLDGVLVGLALLLFFFIFAVAQPGRSGMNSLLLKRGDTVEQQNANVQQILREHEQLPTVRRSPSWQREKLDVVDLGGELHCIWYWMPLFVSLFFVLCPFSLLLNGWYYTGLVIPMLCVVYNSWRFGMHGVICSCVGLKKLSLCDGADFEELYRSGDDYTGNRISIKGSRADLNGKISGDGADSVFEGADIRLDSVKDTTVSLMNPEWEDVLHFVILPNYEEDVNTLRAAIRTVAASKLAKRQIGIVFAMEERDASATSKAEQLQNEFHGSFCFCLATFHPSGIPGETPGKHSNTRWATRYLLEQFVPEKGLDLDNVILTVADADSDFHPEYFPALTYLFIKASGAEGEIPRRHLAIWQAPILHIKNYMRQPALVRLCSWVASLHELANLADPAAIKLAYSTYSLSGKLAACVGGWDPAWISEDMHMSLKCFLATAGRLSIEPIFLSVVNYAPESDSYWETILARWAQAKRHALGFGEFVYIIGNIPKVIAALPCWQDKVTFMYRAYFMTLKILFMHLFLVLSAFIGPVIGSCIVFFYDHHMGRGLLPLFVIFQGITTISLNIGMILSVLLYESQKARIQDTASEEYDTIFWRRPWLHAITGWIQYNMLAPFVFILASFAEWLAAVKVLCSTHLEYEVASKPKECKPGT